MSAVVSAPSRLHFGLLRFKQEAGLSFGGLGMMLEAPRCAIRLAFSDRWQATGPDAERAIHYAKRTAAAAQRAAGANPTEAPPLAIDVQESIPPHQGLGSGTQLALAIAAGVWRLYELPPIDPLHLAEITGRGRRSAIGCHGFHSGGLLFERGSLPGETLGSLEYRIDLPPQWRIILVAASTASGLSGNEEVAAFDHLPPVPRPSTERLEQLARSMRDDVERHNVDSFGEALYEYGRLAGECFAAVQGGPYASAEIAACVDTLRQNGARGVGQSSWGPTVFAVAANQSEAEQLVARMRTLPAWRDHVIRITRPDNHGAQIT
jgi:beta-ribofuranosylaminobenzene 5'-phosphate synthase